MDEPFSPLSQQELPIEIVQGETFILPVTYYDDQGAVIPLTNYTAIMTIRETDTADGTPIIELTTENGLIVITPSAGYVQCTIPAATTKTLPHGFAVYDLFIMSPNHVDERLLFGPVKITPTSQGAEA